MSLLFRNKYRIGSIRCPGYDYSSPGKYFITICTKCKIPFFGNVENGEMILSESGMIAEKLWFEIPDHFKFIELDEFVIMPDHMHGIIIINRNNENNFANDDTVETPKLGVSTTQNTIQTPTQNTIQTPTQNTTPKPEPAIIPNNSGWKSNSIGSIMNQYKRICTIKIKMYGYDFQWQSRFYDHIIRTQTELIRIRKYIKDNPANWDKKK